MNKGFMTIEAVLTLLALLMILEMISTVSSNRISKRYTFLEGSPTCDIECLLLQE